MKRTRIALAAVLVLLLAGSTTPALAGPILLNGSFEIGPPGTSSSVEILTGSPDLYGWTVYGSTSIDYLSAPWPVTDGTHAIDLDGFSSLGGGVSQSFATVPGGIYSVDFDLSGNPDGEPWQKWVRVAVGNFTQDYMFEVVPRQPTRDISWRNVAGSVNSDHAFSGNSDHLSAAKIAGDPISGEGKDDRHAQATRDSGAAAGGPHAGRGGDPQRRVRRDGPAGGGRNRGHDGR